MDTRTLIEQRAQLLKRLRAFLDEQGLIEIDTPLLYPAASPEPYLRYFKTKMQGRNYFLQSSPEFCMKRVIADTQQSVYQICKAFRDEEQGPRHLPEFTMLEWYMVDWQLEQLAAQVERLLSTCLPFEKTCHTSYRDCFGEVLGVDPFDASDSRLRQLLKEHTTAARPERFSRDECLDLLFAEKVEPAFPKNHLVFVHDFPSSQAALAEVFVDVRGTEVARRFEVFSGGMELANAYQEERSSKLLRQRFEKDNALRESLGAELVPMDEALLSAMETDFPQCAGIAMGLERLLMVMLGESDIRSMLSIRERG